MHPLNIIILAVLVGCATPQSFDTGSEQARARIPVFSDANENIGDEACYPGYSDLDPACLPLEPIESDRGDYRYPADEDPQYTAPLAYLDLRTVRQDTSLSHHLKLSEFAKPHQGRWAVVQPHLVEAVQAIRDQLGPVVIGSGYRSPAYNKRVGGVRLSRHQYGDAVDIYAMDASLDEVQRACRSEGASFVEVYSSHVQCLLWLGRAPTLEPTRRAHQQTDSYTMTQAGPAWLATRDVW